jgi:membrane protease YdiL (CAAX protease family)
VLAVVVLLLLVWLALSAWAIARLRVFGSVAFDTAPVRVHHLGLWAILAVSLLYLLILGLAGSRVNLAELEKTPEGAAFFMLFDSVAKALAAIAAIPLILTHVAGGLDGFGLSLRKVPRGIAQGLLAALLIIPWIFVLEIPCAYLSKWIRHAEPPSHIILRLLEQHPSPFAKLILFATACLIAPLLEEFYFRGLLQTTLLGPTASLPPSTPQVMPPSPSPAIEPVVPPVLDYTSSPPGLIQRHRISPQRRWLVVTIASVLFAAIHFDPSTVNLEVLPPLLLLAFALGYLYERTGNLWASITLHAVFNTVSITAVLAGKG